MVSWIQSWLKLYHLQTDTVLYEAPVYRIYTNPKTYQNTFILHSLIYTQTRTNNKHLALNCGLNLNTYKQITLI